MRIGWRVDIFSTSPGMYEEEAFNIVKPDANIGIQPQQVSQGQQGDQQKSGEQGDQQKSDQQGEQTIEDLEGKPPEVGEMDTVMTERGLKSPVLLKSYEYLRGCAEFNNKAPLWNLFDRQTNDTKKQIVDNLIAQKIIKVGAKKPEFGVWAKFKRFIGKDALDWNKFSAVCRQTIQNVKEAAKGGSGGSTVKELNGGDEQGTYDTVAEYADMGKTGAELGLSVASEGLDRFGQSVVGPENIPSDCVNASTALAQSEGMSINGAGSGTIKGMLGMSTASNSLGIIGNIKTVVDDVGAVSDKDTDKMITAADSARGVSNLAEMSRNTANLARAAGDLSTRSIGGVVSNAALTSAVGIGALIGGGAKLTQGILNTIQTTGHIKSLDGVVSGTKNDKIKSSAIVAAVNWWKGANRTRKFVDDHQTFGPEVKGMKLKFDEQAAKYDQEQKAYDEQLTAERKGMGWWDSLKTRFSDTNDYYSFHQTTTAEYLHGLLRQGTTEETRQTPDWQDAQKVILGLGLKVDPKLFEIDDKQKPPVVRKGIPDMARIKKSL